MSSFSSPAESMNAVDDRRSASSVSSVSNGLTRLDWIVIAGALVLLCAMRWYSIYSHRWNTDEPQHLHVVWAWTVGQLQYRDIFDNHTPLFHMLCAPLLSWIGERPDIVLVMRRFMIPLFALSVWCVFRLATVIGNPRIGAYAALIAAFLPAFFFRMGEYRTDVMWTAVWLATLVVAVSGRLTPWRMFFAALLLGTTFSVSMKTTLLALCLALAGIFTWLLMGRPVSKEWPRHVLAFVAGLLVVPGAIVGFFASQHALEPLYRCVIAHNTMPGQHVGQTILKQIFTQSTLWLIPVGFIARAMGPSARLDPQRGGRRLFLFLVMGLFVPLLRALWPVITTQDYMPWMPLLAVFAVLGLDWVYQWLQGRFHLRLPWVLAPVLLLFGEIGYCLSSEPVFTAYDEKRVAGMAATLRLAAPGEYVLDLKGETIFRPRPTYLVLETLTRAQLQSGRMHDDTVENLIAKRVPVVNLSDRMMKETKQFVGENYVRLQGGRALGKRLATTRNTPTEFEIVIPEDYAFVGSKGPISGTIDGQPINGPVHLDAGKHELVVTNHEGETTVIWARALERGFSPYFAPGPQVPE